MAVFDIQPYTPTAQGNMGAAQMQKELSALQSYVYQLTEQLRYALNNIDGENMAKQYGADIARTKTVAEATEALNAVLQSGVQNNNVAVQAAYASLFDSITQNASTIETNYTQFVTDMVNGMATTFAETYVAQADQASLMVEFQNYVVQTAQETVQTFSENQEYIIDVDGVMQTYINAITAYIRTSVDGLEIGQADSPFTSLFSNTRLSFRQNGVEIAYFANNKLYVVSVEAERLTVGTTARGLYDFEVDADGVLFIRGR